MIRKLLLNLSCISVRLIKLLMSVRRGQGSVDVKENSEYFSDDCNGKQRWRNWFFFFFHYKKKRKNVGNVDTNISLMELDMLDWILVVQTHLEIVWTDWWWLTHDRVSNVTEWPIMWTTGENSWRSSAPLQWMSLIVLIITKFFNMEVFNIQYIL